MTISLGSLYSNSTIHSLQNSVKTMCSPLQKSWHSQTKNQSETVQKNEEVKNENLIYQAKGLSIAKKENGYVLNRILDPQARPIKNLIMSGGGIKGMVYPGAIRALQETGYLSGIRAIYGASMGAIMGAMLATGISAEKLETIANNIDYTELLSKNITENTKTSELKKPEKQKTLIDSIKAVYTNLGTTAPRIKQLIDTQTREAALAKITPDHKKNKNILPIWNALNEGGNLTFKDLHTLSQHVEGIKEFHCVATVLIEGESPQLTVLSADTTPDWDISLAACISSALPGILAKFEHPMPGFDSKDGAKKRYIDGGLLMNTPAPGIIHADTAASDNLILAVESPMLDQAMEDALADKGDLSSLLMDKILGVPHTVAFKYMCKQLASKFKEQTVVADLQNTDMQYNYVGVAGLLALHMTSAQRNDLQSKLYKKTLEHLENRSSKTHFDTLDQLLYSLDDKEFDTLVKKEIYLQNTFHTALQNIQYFLKNITGTFLSKIFTIINHWLNQFTQKNTQKTNPDIIHALQKVKPLREDAILNRITAFFNMLQKWNEEKQPTDIAYDISQWENNCAIYAANNPIYQHFIADRIVNSSHPQLEKIAEIFRKTPTPLHSFPIVEKILIKMREKNIKNSAQYIIKNFIYPAKNKRKQLNIALLTQAENALEAAKTAKDINDCLDTLAQKYRLEPLGKFASNITGKTAKDIKKTAHFITTTIALPIAEKLRSTQNNHTDKTAPDLTPHIDTIEKCITQLLDIKNTKQFENILNQIIATLESITPALKAQTSPLSGRLIEYIKRPEDIIRSTFLRELQTYKLSCINEETEKYIKTEATHCISEIPAGANTLPAKLLTSLLKNSSLFPAQWLSYLKMAAPFMQLV